MNEKLEAKDVKLLDKKIKTDENVAYLQIEIGKLRKSNISIRKENQPLRNKVTLDSKFCARRKQTRCNEKKEHSFNLPRGDHQRI